MQYLIKNFDKNNLVTVPEIVTYLEDECVITADCCSIYRDTNEINKAIIMLDNSKKYFSVASGGGTGRTLHPDNMAAGPASYGLTDTMGRMHSDAQFAGSSSVPAHVEMMGLLGAGNNPMAGMSVAVAVAIEEASK